MGIPAVGRVRTSCSLCGGQLVEEIAELEDVTSGECFAVHRCQECALGHTVPVPGDISRYYGTQYYGNRHGVTDQYCLWRRRRFVAAMADLPKGGTLLDIGCGDGAFLASMANAGWQGTGVEIGGPLGNLPAGRRVVATLADAEKYGPYDCVTAWHSLEHFTDLREPLEVLPRLVRPGGCLIIAVPDAGGRQARLMGARWLHRDVPRHLYHFTQASLREFFLQAGMQVERTWHAEYEYDLLGYVQGVLDGWFREPRVFFHLLTGKRVAAGTAGKLLHASLGSLLMAMLAPLPWLDASQGAGGTLVMAGRWPGSSGAS